MTKSTSDNRRGDCAVDETDYISKRRRQFQRISKLDPLPISEKAPNTAEILAEVREGEAR